MLLGLHIYLCPGTTRAREHWGEFRLLERVRADSRVTPSSPLTSLVQEGVMQITKGPTSSGPWGKGPRVEERSHRQSRNTNTSIFYVHNYEKEERDRHSRQGAHKSVMCCSQEPSSWKTVLSISKGLFQNWGRQLVQVWWPQGGRHSLVTCLRHSSWLGLSSHLPPAANTLHSPELQT